MHAKDREETAHMGFSKEPLKGTRISFQRRGSNLFHSYLLKRKQFWQVVTRVNQAMVILDGHFSGRKPQIMRLCYMDEVIV